MLTTTGSQFGVSGNGIRITCSALERNRDRRSPDHARRHDRQGLDQRKPRVRRTRGCVDEADWLADEFATGHDPVQRVLQDARIATASTERNIHASAEVWT